MVYSMSFAKRPWVIITLAGVLLFLLLLFWPIKGLKSLQDKSQSLILLDRNSQEIVVSPLNEGLRRIYLDIDEIPKDLQRVILDSEDRRFYLHGGVDALSILRAFWMNYREKRIVSGGSTITMQLSRLMNPRSVNYQGKLSEIFHALRIDLRFSKKRILEHYINHLPFGRNLEGFEAASRYFYGEAFQYLTEAEVLVLMMIPRSPSLYDPLANPQEVYNACLRTLPRLRADIEPEGIREALDRISHGAPHPWPGEAPHFTNWIKGFLGNQGGTVETSMDLACQTVLEDAIRYYVEGAVNHRISNGAGIVINSKSGEILAYSGSVDYYNEEHSGQIDGVQILRQPGSTLKPFLYGLALDMGFSNTSVLPDIPMGFGGQEIYVPENYNERFNGPVLFNTALASSLNVPAVYLLERVGVENFTNTLLECGFTSLESQRDHLGLGLALGNGEVRLFELAQAYQIFVNGGRFHSLSGIPQYQSQEERSVLSPSSADQIRKNLSNPLYRILGFGRDSFLEREYPSFFKTGTSNQFNNIWAVGGTHDLIVVIWMGNFSGETVIGAPGSSIPAMAVVEVLDELHNQGDFQDHTEFIRRFICPVSGMLAGPYCHGRVEAEFPEEQKLETCEWHTGQGTVYPGEFQNWFQDRGVSESYSFTSLAPRIIEPMHNSLFYFDISAPEDSQRIPVKIEGSDEAVIYYDGAVLYDGFLPFETSIPLSDGLHSISLFSGLHSEVVEFSVIY